MKFQFKALLQNSGWLENVLIETDNNGKIISIEENPARSSEDLAIPGFQNAHSHSFQYAMAGLAERHSPEGPRDDFWSWRKSMYSLALSVDPEQFEAIAAMLYSEMLRHGYTNVAEFHYLHHDKDGKQYENPAELSARLINAAKTAGINITIIPIFYQKGGFGKSPEEDQRRFISNTIEDYQKLFEAVEKECKNQTHANIGIGIHSMRAVAPQTIQEVSESFPKNIPFHIHISEQLKEVEDSLAFLGKRPVEWMLENIELSDRFHFVHATHLIEKEIKGLAEQNVNVVLCPTTEGNLGDGLFPVRHFQQKGGKWSIGTDSHVSLNPFEELRLLDYGQRLITHRRNTFSDETNGNSAHYAIEQATLTGRKAMNNFTKEFFAVGEPLNACVISSKHPLLQTSSTQNLLNTILYSTDETMQKGTITNGNWMIKNDLNYREDKITQRFVKAINELKTR